MADLKQITIPVLEDGSITNKTYNLGGGGDAVGSFYGTCDTNSITADKVVSIPGEFKLSIGTLITIKFTNTNTASNPTLNVNGTGAKSIYYNNALVSTGALQIAGYANRVITYLYDGTNWVFQSWGVDNSGVATFNGRTGNVTPASGDYDADQIDYDNSGSDLSSTNVNDAIDEVSTKISGYWTSTVNALVGDTTVTITDSAIKTTSVVEAYSQNASGSVTPIDGITVTNGQAVIRMPALTEATTFKLWIDENKVPSGGSVSVTADGVKTWSALLDELFALVDFTKITSKSTLERSSGYFYHLMTKTATPQLTFTREIYSSLRFTIHCIIIIASGSTYSSGVYSANGFEGNTDYSSQILPSGEIVTIKY